MIHTYKKNIIGFYFVSAAALCFAVFFDLKIDIWLNNPENPVCIWFYNTGEIPCRLIMPFAGTVIFYTAEKMWQRTAGLLVNLGGSAYMGTYIAKHFFVEKNQLAFGIAYGIGFGVMLLLFGRLVHIPEGMKKPLFVLAIAGIAVMVVQLSCIEGMKYLWGRVRFRDLLADGSYDAFTPWYVLNGINGNKSFPSGHTAGAGMSYLLMLFPFVFDEFKDKKQLCFWLPCVYTSTVAFTRLVMGAHYLSDVTVGGIVSFSLVLLAMAILQKKDNILLNS